MIQDQLSEDFIKTFNSTYLFIYSFIYLETLEKNLSSPFS